MAFINPIELLELQNLELNSIDNTAIKKAKRKLYVEIDLSDNHFSSYKGQHLTKSDCEKAIAELEDQTIKAYYLHLAIEQTLNSYLVNGHESFFTSFKHALVYEQTDFIQLIILVA